MHTMIDEIVQVSNESAYAETIARAGTQDLLFQTYTNGVGHCQFTGTQFITAINAIYNWVQHRHPPDCSLIPAGLWFCT